MKCDKLKAEQWLDYSGEPRPCYPQKDVDSAIDELKREHHRERDEYISFVNKLQKKNAELKGTYKESVEVKVKIWERCKKAEDNLRKTQRAMWIARAERAYVTTLLWNIYCYQNNCLYFRDFMNIKCNPFRSLPKKTAMEWSNLWESIETKLRAKAKEYE